jgi:hypothetical protein
MSINIWPEFVYVLVLLPHRCIGVSEHQGGLPVEQYAKFKSQLITHNRTDIVTLTRLNCWPSRQCNEQLVDDSRDMHVTHTQLVTGQSQQVHAPYEGCGLTVAFLWDTAAAISSTCKQSYELGMCGQLRYERRERTLANLDTVTDIRLLNRGTTTSLHLDRNQKPAVRSTNRISPTH